VTDLDDWLWNTVTAPSDRGMSEVREAASAQLFSDAARALIAATDPIVIGTGFPIGGPPETDGPPGAFALHDALLRLDKTVALASWSEANTIFAKVRPDIEYLRIPRHAADGEPSPELDGACFVAIEVCGLTEDETYRDMHHNDISDLAPNFEQFIGREALVAIGDGGNEFGMGDLPDGFFERWNVIPPVSTAKHLLPSMVSNFGAYALVLALQVESGKALLPDTAAHLRCIEQLVAEGCVDGMSRKHEPKVDGHPLAETENLLNTLANRARTQQK
jgi:hypothetical protein